MKILLLDDDGLIHSLDIELFECSPNGTPMPVHNVQALNNLKQNQTIKIFLMNRKSFTGLDRKKETEFLIRTNREEIFLLYFNGHSQVNSNFIDL